MNKLEVSEFLKEVFSKCCKSPEEIKKERRKEKEQEKKDFNTFKSFIMDNFNVSEDEMKKMCKTETFNCCFFYFALLFRRSIDKEENIMNFYKRSIDKIRRDLQEEL